MKRSGFSTVLIVLAVLFISYHPTVFAEICNRLVAVVNNDVITLYELNQKIRELTGLKPADLKARDNETYLETRRKILDILIDEKIALKKIRELEINVTPEEIDATIEMIKRNNGITQEDLLIGLKNQGMSYNSYRERVKKEMEQMRLINFEVKSKIIISEEKIKEYYNQHENDFVGEESEEKVHLATIFLLKDDDLSDQNGGASLYQKAEGLLLRLKNGEDFGELAMKNSQGPAADKGGDIGLFKLSELDSELADMIENMSNGDVSKPIIRPSGIQIIKLIGRRKVGEKRLEDVRDEIYSILYREEQQRVYSSWIKELRKEAYTKIIF